MFSILETLVNYCSQPNYTQQYVAHACVYTYSTVPIYLLGKGLPTEAEIEGSARDVWHTRTDCRIRRNVKFRQGRAIYHIYNCRS